MFPDWCGSALITAACAGSLSRACQAAPTFLAASASPSGPRSPAMAVRLGLNAGSRGELVGDGAGVARHGGRGGVDLVDEQGQGAGDAGGAGLFEPDGDGVGGPGDGAGFVVVAQVGVEVG